MSKKILLTSLILIFGLALVGAGCDVEEVEEETSIVDETEVTYTKVKS